MIKRKLVHSFGAHASEHKPLPQQYVQAKQRWVCVVSVEIGNSVVDEYEIKPDRKLYLDDFLDIVKVEIEQFDNAHSTDWRVDIYRLTGSR
ncbi:MAG: hypothetical protein KDI21_13925 [Halieaceae bacterium]|nr:hypothetical protein [Halieaceae bacterium]